MGHKAVTVNNRTCQVWTSNSPHSHRMHDANMYPDSTVAEAQNYCRNPNNSPVGLWCYTTDPAVRWERCNVPLCGESTCCSTRGSVGIVSGVFRGRAMVRPSLVFGLTRDLFAITKFLLNVPVGFSHIWHSTKFWDPYVFMQPDM